MCYTSYGEAIVDENLTTYENPFKFSGKELDDITGLYDHGARSRNPVSTLWYGVDPLFEKYPDFSPYNYCAGNPVKLVDLDGRKPTKDEAAAMSDYVYGYNSLPEEERADIDKQMGNWKLCTEEIKDEEFKLENRSSGFKSLLFYNSETDEYCYATAGTDSNPLDIGDAIEDYYQALGFPLQQYQQSVKNAQILKDRFGSKLSFTGHSLGGGLATANAIFTGNSAITFNPAGLNIRSILSLSVVSWTFPKKCSIQNYIMASDPLNKINIVMQNYPFGEVHIMRHYDNDGGGHSITNFFKPTKCVSNQLFNKYLLEF